MSTEFNQGYNKKKKNRNAQSQRNKLPKSHDLQNTWINPKEFFHLQFTISLVRVTRQQHRRNIRNENTNDLWTNDARYQIHRAVDEVEQSLTPRQRETETERERERERESTRRPLIEELAGELLIARSSRNQSDERREQLIRCEWGVRGEGDHPRRTPPVP